MDLKFKNWLEDCGEVTSTYSNVNDLNFDKKGLNSNYTGGRRRPEKSKLNPDKLFKCRKHRSKNKEIL